MSREAARIVHVEDEYSAVINRGSDNGVNQGDRYLVFHLGQELFDPDTKETLGILEIVRGKAVVTHVQEKMSTIESIEIKVTAGAKKIVKRSTSNALAAFAIGGDTREEVEEGPTRKLLPLGAIDGDHAKAI